MKFKFDENLGTIGRDLLRAAGHDVSTVALQGMSGWNDVAVYETCRSEARILVTLDRDFGEIIRFPPENTAGIVVLDCRGQLSPSAIAARMSDLLAGLAIHSPEGRLWIVEPGRLRIHGRTDDPDGASSTNTPRE